MPRPATPGHMPASASRSFPRARPHPRGAAPRGRYPVHLSPRSARLAPSAGHLVQHAGVQACLALSRVGAVDEPLLSERLIHLVETPSLHLDHLRAAPEMVVAAEVLGTVARDLEEGEAAMRDAAGDQLVELDRQRRGPAGHKGRARRGHEATGIEAGLPRSARRGRRGLPAGHAVDLVVQEEAGEVHVAPRGVNKVIPTDREAIAVAGDDDDREVRPRELQPSGEREGSPVRRMHGGPIDVSDETARAPDARDEGEPVPVELEPFDRTEERLQDDPMPAARTEDVRHHPAAQVLAVLDRERHATPSAIPATRAAISSGVSGKPSARKHPSTGTAPATTRSTSSASWPRFISATTIARTRDATARSSRSGKGQIVRGRKRPARTPWARAISTARAAARAAIP